MKDRIVTLPPLLANQIAAGEVVERPASVIKELLENSLDAKSTRIAIDIEGAGTQLIRLQDNGIGIHHDDLELACARHATSKISDPADLVAIASLGFRGEALASITSISRFTLTSRWHGTEDAWSLRYTTEGLSVIKPAAHPTGTTIEVRDLFYNTPARRKFLHSEKTEFYHIEEIIKRIALSHFEVAFCLQHQQKTILDLPIGTSSDANERRVGKIFGNAFLKKAFSLDIATSNLRLFGWLGLPDYTRSQTDMQFFYVNGRCVRDKVVTHAIRQAYGDHLYQGRHPVYVLYLELPVDQVDVNVHPTKHEVRFREARLVHDFVFRRLREVLTGVQVPSNHAETSIMTTTASTELYNNHHLHPSTYQVQQNLETYQHWHDTSAPEKLIEKPKHLQVSTRILGQLHDQFLLVETNPGLKIFDIHRIKILTCYYRLLEATATHTLKRQPLLLPLSLSLSEELLSIAETHSAFLEQIGLEITRSSPHSTLIRTLPSVLYEADVTTLVLEVLSALQISAPKETILKIMAKQARPSANTHLSLEQIDVLLLELQWLETKATPAEQKTLSIYQTLDSIQRAFISTEAR